MFDTKWSNLVVQLCHQIVYQLLTNVELPTVIVISNKLKSSCVVAMPRCHHPFSCVSHIGNLKQSNERHILQRIRFVGLLYLLFIVFPLCLVQLLFKLCYKKSFFSYDVV